MRRLTVIAASRRSFRALFLASLVNCAPMLSAPAEAQSPSTTLPAATTTTTSTVTTTTTTTTTTLPPQLRALDAFSHLATNIRRCHRKDALRTSRRHKLQLQCEEIVPPGQKTRCHRKVRQAYCRNRDRTESCEERARISALLPVGAEIANQLLQLLGDDRGHIACAIPELAPEDCPRRTPKRVGLPSVTCTDGPCECTTAALSVVPDAVARAANCRRTAFSKALTGEVYDESACRQMVWKACETPKDCAGQCVNLSTRCDEAETLVNRILPMIAPTDCVDDNGFVTCDDNNPCTTDERCDGHTCQRSNHDGVACTDGMDDSPCTRDVCKGGTCVNMPADGASCETDNNACTDDVCGDGQCTHVPSAAMRCKPCDDSGCMVCVAGACVPVDCPPPCRCIPKQGCVGFCGDPPMCR